MKNVLMILMMFLPSISTSANAQFTDKQQQKDWFYLQVLSAQIEETQTCILTLGLNAKSEAWDQAWETFYQQTNELSQEIDLYVDKYKDDNTQADNQNALTYRVWSVMFNVQNKTKELNELECLAKLTL